LSKPIKDIEGIGPIYAEKLADIGIHTVHALLDKGCTRSGRKELAEKTGISETLVLEWVNMEKLVRQLPTLDIVKKWIEQAKTLPKKVEY